MKSGDVMGGVRAARKARCSARYSALTLDVARTSRSRRIAFR